MDELAYKLKNIVGVDYVIANQEQLTPYNQGTFTSKYKNSLVVKPRNNEEIIAILTVVKQYNASQTATSNKTALYTVSSGKNWGYSAQEPSFDNAILLKLSRIKKIESYWF